MYIVIKHNLGTPSNPMVKKVRFYYVGLSVSAWMSGGCLLLDVQLKFLTFLDPLIGKLGFT